jgi:hypothetical protein
MTTWYDVARDSRKAASEVVSSRYRSCLSRAYYAAYSKVAQLLAEKGVPMPAGREGPNHPGHLPTGEAASNGIRQMIVTQLMDIDVPKRRKLSELIGSLYTLRLYADYRPSIDIDAADAREAVSMMNTVFDAF